MGTGKATAVAVFGELRRLFGKQHFFFFFLMFMSVDREILMFKKRPCPEGECV